MGQVVVHYVEHGTGRPVLVLHGAGVDHREAEACFELVFDGVAGLRRIYPDLPGMGRTIAPETMRSADDVLDTLLNFAEEVIGGTGHLIIGHSAGAYYAQAMATRRPAQVAGLALVCPLLPECATSQSTALSPDRVRSVTTSSGVLRDPNPGDARTVRALRRPGRRARRPGSARTNRRTVALTPITPRLTRVRQRSWRGGWTRRSGMPPLSTSSTTTRTPRSPWSTTRGTPYPTSNRNSCAPSSVSGSSASSAQADPERSAPISIRDGDRHHTARLGIRGVGVICTATSLQICHPPPTPLSASALRSLPLTSSHP